jgi:hypothetical protein
MVQRPTSSTGLLGVWLLDWSKQRDNWAPGIEVVSYQLVNPELQSN